MPHKKSTNKKKSKNQKKNTFFTKKRITLLTKLFILIILLLCLHYKDFSRSNSLTLLAVTGEESKEGTALETQLEITRGTGKIYMNLDSIKETDTQISIRNAKETACDLFKLNCNSYNYYFTFEGNSEILKGPSAGAGMTLLIINTIMGKNMPDETAITGTINHGGIIGNVHGIEEKVMAARKKGKTQVIIPYASNYTKTVEGVEVKKAIDIFRAYEIINNEKYERDYTDINTTKYKSSMKELAINLCNRSKSIKEELKEKDITQNMSNNTYYKNFRDSLNSSENALVNQKYYSTGSFCFNSNINGRILLLKHGKSNQSLRKTYQQFNQTYKNKYQNITSNEYLSNVKTYNDFYVYLILRNRIKETDNYFQNIKIENLTSKDIYNLAYAMERFQTVMLWEQLLTHEGKKLSHLSYENVQSACNKIMKKLIIKNEYIKDFGVNYETNLQKLRNTSSPYICTYNGLELMGKMDTMINMIGIKKNNLNKFNKAFQNITHDRILMKAEEDKFPILPYIYYEYSTELSNSNAKSSFMYANYALSFNYIDYYLKNQQSQLKEEYPNYFLKELFTRDIYVIILLIMLFIL